MTRSKWMVEKNKLDDLQKNVDASKNVEDPAEIDTGGENLVQDTQGAMMPDFSETPKVSREDVEQAFEQTEHEDVDTPSLDDEQSDEAA